MPEIGDEGQKKISAASVLCIGAGGLGCPALLYLAAAGVGRIGVVDFDVVDESNLQRQVLFQTDQVGQNKAQAAQNRLTALNPEIEIEAYPYGLDADNAMSLFKSYDVIIDGTDNFSSKFLINDAAVKAGKPFVYGSILGFEGQLSVFNYKGGPCYRCLFPEAPKSHIPNCAQAGVIGAIAGMVGTVQAMEAIKIIVDHEDLPPLSGAVQIMDIRHMDHKRIALEKDPHCTICSLSTEDIILRAEPLSCDILDEITPMQLHKKTDILLLDVREKEEWDAGHIEGAQHFALSALENGARPDLPKNQDIILYCQRGMRGQKAGKILQKQNSSGVYYNLKGGYEAWLRDRAA